MFELLHLTNNFMLESDDSMVLQLDVKKISKRQEKQIAVRFLGLFYLILITLGYTYNDPVLFGYTHISAIYN